jgi:hypothetical protein
VDPCDVFRTRLSASRRARIPALARSRVFQQAPGGYAGRTEIDAANDLIQKRFMLREDLERVLARATAHWDFATGDREQP